MLQEGLLWFDDDPVRATSDKIARAARRYLKKYGQRPNVCYVHPAHLKEGNVQPPDGVKVLPAKTVLPFHFWIGIQIDRKKRK